MPSVRTAQECEEPPVTAVKVPLRMALWPLVLSPQQSMVPLTRSPQVCRAPALVALYALGGSGGWSTVGSVAVSSLVSSVSGWVLVSVGVVEGVSTRPRALARKVAIWERLTGPRVQNCSGSFVQPTVIPAAASASMLASWLLPSVSTKPAGPAASRSKARTKSVAIWPRLTEVSGQ